jgi:small neutral amino acid transporter SnatA (MarC family)
MGLSANNIARFNTILNRITGWMLVALGIVYPVGGIVKGVSMKFPIAAGIFTFLMGVSLLIRKPYTPEDSGRSGKHDL